MADGRSRRVQGRMVLAVAGDDDDWSVVRGFVASLSWQIELVALSLAPDEPDLSALLPPLDGLDAAIVVLARARGRADVGGPDRLAQLGMLIGLLQGRLGPGRVLVLAEAEVASQVAATGITASTYRRGAIEAHHPRVEALLADAARLEAGPRPFATSRLGLALTSLAPELWLVLGPLLVLGSVLAVLGLGILNWRASSSDGSRSSALSPEGPAADASSADPGVPGTVAVDATVPAGMAIDLLPVTCVVEIPDGASLPVVVPCQDRGELRVDGYLGPWRDEIDSVGLASGVVGTAQLAAGDQAAGAVQLAPGRDQVLASAGSRPGVDRLELIFGADGQQVVLRQAPARGGNTATLTFSLG